MTRLAADWVARPETQAVCAMLTEAGHAALFVGGCVRNTLLGEPVSDIDIATDARPERVIELAEAAGLKPVATGIDHGTVTIVVDDHPHEVTTFRRDVETDGRRAVVAFTERVEEDARRRDFTMNALYARPDGTLIDPLGGLGDLKSRRVRFIEDPKARIREDYLRILRFFRFHAWYGDPAGGLDPDGFAACAALSEGLDSLSRERVGSELKRLLSAPDPAPSASAMQAAGCLSHILPGAETSPLAPLVHHEAEFGVMPDPMRRLAVLGGEDAADRLRLSKIDARHLDAVRQAALGSAGAAELGYRLGADRALDALLVRAALTGGAFAANAVRDIEVGVAARFPIRAADLMPQSQGPALGEKLRDLEKRWIASGFALGRKDLLG